MSDRAGVGPTGTVTFLFSDVVGSTRLWAADPDAMARSLRLHDRMLRDAATAHGGYVFSTAGDSFAIAFDRPSAATACAATVLDSLAAADWDTGPALTVRLGLHLGEADERDGDYFGPTLNLAARVMGAAHGGQCLLTHAVAQTVPGTVDLGHHDLRDIPEPTHLFQLGDTEFPPLYSAATGIVSLPSPRTSLVGRDDTVVQVGRLLAEHRLVTLTGVGGCGKTRLGIEVARREVPTFVDGVWFVDLSTVASDDAIYGVFATALDLAAPDRELAPERIAEYLSQRDALVVVDNCEHVIDEAAEFVDLLLGRAPRLRVLATSREPLEIDGEHSVRVASLDRGEGGAAFELFVDRAVAAGVTLGTDAETRAVVADIVERLDGVPLAIELAAGRARSMGLTEIRDRLDDRFRILAGGKRRSRQRQATLEAAVQWSYDLLDEREQHALRCLSVFQGGFDLADVAAVLAVDDADAFDLVDSLVTKSLVDVTTDARGRMRHRLLETIRLFGLARLIDTGTAETVRDRHLEHFAHDEIAATMSRWLDLASLERIDREYENFRAAAEWALERDRTDDTVKIAAILSDAAPPRADLGTVIEWMQLPSTLTGRDRVFVHALLAHALNVAGQPDRALERLPDAIEDGRRLGCDDTVFALLDLGVARGIEGDVTEQVAKYQEARGWAETHFGDAHVTTCAVMFQVITQAWTGDFAGVVTAVTERREACRTFGYAHIFEAWHAFALLMLGRPTEALELVAAFSPVPASSQWGAMNLVAEHIVLAAVEGEEAALRAFAPRAAEFVARRPAVAPDLLMAFGLLELRLGNREFASRCADLQSFGAGPVFSQLLTELAGMPTAAERTALLERESQRLDFTTRMATTASTAPGLLAEAVSRWS